MQNNPDNSEITHWALTQATVECGLDRLVLVALADRADKDRYAYPFLKTLAEIAVHGEAAVRKALRRLVVGGLIRQVKDDLPPRVLELPAWQRPAVYELLAPPSEPSLSRA